MWFEVETKQRPRWLGPFQSVFSGEEGTCSGKKGKYLQNLQGKLPVLFTIKIALGNGLT